MEQSIGEKLETILEWAEERRDAGKGSFDTSFVESVQVYYYKFDRVTERQEAAIDSLIAKWEIPV